jgi:hypothetical protein
MRHVPIIKVEICIVDKVTLYTHSCATVLPTQPMVSRSAPAVKKKPIFCADGVEEVCGGDEAEQDAEDYAGRERGKVAVGGVRDAEVRRTGCDVRE